jgi:transcriptional regulator with XRE-family HTH domain
VLAQLREVTGISLDFLIAGTTLGIEDPGTATLECTATFAERVQWARELFGASAADLAAKMQVPLTTYIRWETGRDVMPKDKLEQFAHSFSVTVQYLENGNPSGLKAQVLRQLQDAHPGLWQAGHTDTAPDADTKDHTVATVSA